MKNAHRFMANLDAKIFALPSDTPNGKAEFADPMGASDFCRPWETLSLLERGHSCPPLGSRQHQSGQECPRSDKNRMRRGPIQTPGRCAAKAVRSRFAGLLLVLGLIIPSALNALAAETNAPVEVKNLSVNGEINEDQARLVIQANLKSPTEDKLRPIYATTLWHQLRADRRQLDQTFQLQCDFVQGEPKELVLAMAGQGEIRQVTGEGLMDWSLRQETNGQRFLVLRLAKTEKARTQFKGTINAQTKLSGLPVVIQPLTLTPPNPALFNGYVRLEGTPELDLQLDAPAGIVPIEFKFLPESLRGPSKDAEPPPLAFRFLGSSYTLPLKLALADPESRQVGLTQFLLTGKLSDTLTEFVLTATARVKNPRGGSLVLLSGDIALTEPAQLTGGKLVFSAGRFRLVFDGPGEFPVSLKFNAKVRTADGWNTLDFRVAPASLESVVFQGLAADTQFRFAGAAKPERKGNDFLSFLPANGEVKVAWKEARPEAEGKLFYAAEMLAQVAVSPGLMRQWALITGKVMQGELTRLAISLRGEGEVTRVQGDQVLSWNVIPGPDTNSRCLVVQFNQPLKDLFSLQVQLQTPLGAFPQTLEPVQLRPDNATRFSGYFRIVNEGAVRLEVSQASGLSQISPEQFPETDATKGLLPSTSNQRFAFRFTGADYQLRLQADNVLPELAVSELLTYHLGDTELSVEAEVELDIREAPVRELQLRVPKGFALARLTASGLSDYFLKEEDNEPDASLRLVYAQPISGRQVVQFRLERNKALGDTNWSLPRIDIPKAKSVRGNVGVSADPGYRLTPTTAEGLTEIATAFFPRKLAGIQTAFRLSEPNWRATLRVERLPQSIQADVVHLFSIGEGIAYGSSIVNYLISGAPLANFKLELSAEYANVEFTGKDIRSWRKTDTGYEIQLHSPVSGAYTLLATYERSFKPQGETLTFTGARPVDAQSEQGHTLVISTYQFQVKPVSVSAGLMPLEPGEVPGEYRLFFDAPILAAYRYASRPFNLQLALSPLAQGETLSQVVDRATLTTRISKEGQVVTDVRFFVKNRQQPHLRLILPEGTQLWSATVNGLANVPVTDGPTNLIALPQHTDPNAVNTVDIKLASRSKNPRRVTVAAPIVQAPVMLAEWKMLPDSGQRLVYRKGSLRPSSPAPDRSGFAMVRQALPWRAGNAFLAQGLIALALITIAVVVWRWSGREGAFKYNARFVLGALIGFIAAGFAVFNFVQMAGAWQQNGRSLPTDLAFLAPVQQAGSALQAEVDNLPLQPGPRDYLGRAWPGLLAAAVWFYSLISLEKGRRQVGWILGWTLFAFMTLRWPNGAPAFIGLCLGFLLLQVIGPALWRLWQVPPKPPKKPPTSAAEPSAAATAVTLLALGVFLGQANWVAAQEASAITTAKSIPTAVAESVIQEIRVEDQFARATVKIHWTATNGQTLPILFEPAVLTRIDFPATALKLFSLPGSAKRSQSLLATQSGTYDIELEYQMQITTKDNENGLVLPTQYGLVNKVILTLVDLDVDVTAPQAVSIRRETPAGTKNTLATLILSPANEAWLGWKPRSRDTKHEKAVFYAELFQLYIPSAGVIQGFHQTQIRPAQGELSELVFTVPTGLTIIDVLDPLSITPPEANSPAPKSLISLWRFNPDTRTLRVSLNPPQAKPFGLLIKSQMATGPLPFEHAVGLITVANAAGQIGQLGVATTAEVQLDGFQAENFSPINIEDFPPALLQSLQASLPGLTLRRAGRYSDSSAQATLKAAAVEPDVRIEAQQTLSLGEDRTVLAINAGVDITRAGIFRLSFVLPAGLDIESITGAALSHWTELKSDAGRIITLHLKGKTEGHQVFDITLAGPGLKTAKGWAVPKLAFREAAKQRGQLVIVPEQGMRLQTTTREGVTQLDPQKAGIRQKGVLAFRILSEQWALALDLEQVDPWIQVTSLQHATVNEAQIKVTANLQYQIENTGLKSFRILLPANADSVRFLGDQVADFLARPGQSTNRMQEWDVKLHRRMIGTYLLQVSYQLLIPEQSRNADIRGVQAIGVNLQRGFLTVQSSGRLQVRVPNLPVTLQPAEWQSIPRALQQDLPSQSANFTFRLVEPAYDLPLQLDRHEAAKLLPARVNSVALTSVISDDGVMLTQVRIDLVAGDKRLLHLTLPSQAKFWFAFVNQNGVWPWRDQDQILIPLDQNSKSGQSLAVEFFYSSQIGAAESRKLDLELRGPQMDLPLENISWRVFLNEKWHLKHWSGSLQLSEERAVITPEAINLEAYLQNEATQQSNKTKEAEQMLKMGNSLLQQGDPQQARQAFQAAYGLSSHDNAFNEDARVQLHNLKMQQAMVGLNFRQAAVGGEPGAVGGKLRDLRNRKNLTYTQDEAKEIIERNGSEENTALTKLAERLIQQQDAAVAAPTAIRAAIPEQGRLFTFVRSVQVDTWTDLKLNLIATAAKTTHRLANLAILGAVLMVFAALNWLVRSNKAA